MHNSTCQAGRLAKAPNLCDVSCSAGIWSLSRSFRLRAVDDDTVQQQAPAAEAGAELLDLPFESDMKSFTGGSTGSITPAAAAGTMLGPSRLSLKKPSAWSSFGTCMLSSLHSDASATALPESQQHTGHVDHMQMPSCEYL
jgi:hypothetical protein